MLAEQIREFSPELVAVRDGSRLEELRELIKDAPRQPEIVVGDQGAIDVASHPAADAVVRIVLVSTMMVLRL